MLWLLLVSRLMQEVEDMKKEGGREREREEKKEQYRYNLTNNMKMILLFVYTA